MAYRVEDIQAEVLRAYTVLCSARPGWSGALIVNLNLGLGSKGSAISFAANIAGAVCLSLEPDAALLRNALRAGSCDFVVNTLDEALRVIKNEVRKRRPLSVGLEGDPATLLGEIMARGVAPELFTAPNAQPKAAAYFRSLGAFTVSFEEDATPTAEVLTAASVLEDFLSTHAWQLRTFDFTTSAGLRAFDLRALTLIPAEDRLRHQWLVSAGRIFPRERRRALWLTEQEFHTLQTAPA